MCGCMSVTCLVAVPSPLLTRTSLLAGLCTTLWGVEQVHPNGWYKPIEAAAAAGGGGAGRGTASGGAGGHGGLTGRSARGTPRSVLSRVGSSVAGSAAAGGAGGGAGGAGGGAAAQATASALGRKKKNPNQRKAVRIKPVREPQWLDDSVSLLTPAAQFYIVPAPVNKVCPAPVPISQRRVTSPPPSFQPFAQSREVCLAVKYGGISALAEHANRGTFLNRGCITVLVGTGKVAPEPSQGQYLWGLTVGNRRVGDLDTVSGRQLTQPDMDVQNLVLARGYRHQRPPLHTAKRVR